MTTDALTSHLHSATHEVDQAHQAAQAAAAVQTGRERGPHWLRALQHLHTARSDLADAEQLAALEARRYHAATWQQIADVYGITRQAAQQRFTPPDVNAPLTTRIYVPENKPSELLDLEHPCYGCGATADSYCDCPDGPQPIAGRGGS